MQPYGPVSADDARNASSNLRRYAQSPARMVQRQLFGAIRTVSCNPRQVLNGFDDVGEAGLFGHRRHTYTRLKGKQRGDGCVTDQRHASTNRCRSPSTGSVPEEMSEAFEVILQRYLPPHRGQTWWPAPNPVKRLGRRGAERTGARWAVAHDGHVSMVAGVLVDKFRARRSASRTARPRLLSRPSTAQSGRGWRCT